MVLYDSMENQTKSLSDNMTNAVTVSNTTGSGRTSDPGYCLMIHIGGGVSGGSGEADSA